MNEKGRHTQKTAHHLFAIFFAYLIVILLRVVSEHENKKRLKCNIMKCADSTQDFASSGSLDAI